ncbi:MAG: hypothetical protein HY849_05705 [Nitrosomonadales bacterium]|nr:hypothetical protein [Nitrosomonadales bacterium]
MRSRALPRSALPRRQRGVVLLIALIVLVAMTLAGIGMMRSVDTGTLVAGNLAFKQSTTQAGDRGTNDGYNALMAIAANTTDKQVLALASGSACPAGVTASLCPGGNVNVTGYSPTPLNACEVTNTCTLAQQQWWDTAANWAAAPATTLTDANGATIATVSYLIHRMCTAAGASANTTCLTSAGISSSGNSMKHDAPNLTTNTVYYRITSRSAGPRGTVSVTQTMALVSE